MGRPSWDEYFIGLTHSAAARSTCDRGRAGCVIVKDRRIIATGYAGSPEGFPHCDDVGHQIKKMIHVDEDNRTTEHCVRTIHAEQNAICQAARYGASVDGATLYCTMTPCRVCAMLIINCGIKRVVSEYRYQTSEETEAKFAAATIELVHINDTRMSYANGEVSKDKDIRGRVSD